MGNKRKECLKCAFEIVISEIMKAMEAEVETEVAVERADMIQKAKEIKISSIDVTAMTDQIVQDKAV